MSRYWLYSVLLGCSLAMLLFVAGFVCWQLGVGLLASLFYLIAGKVMLLAFLLLALWAVVGAVSALSRGFTAYFNREAMTLRQLLATRAKQLETQQRLPLESRQVRYWAQFTRRRIEARNDKKHLRALFKAISRELREQPVPDKKLWKALRSHYKNADAAAMMALRKQIPCR